MALSIVVNVDFDNKTLNLLLNEIKANQLVFKEIV